MEPDSSLPYSQMPATSAIYIYIYAASYVQPEDGSKKPKHVTESYKFVRYLIKNLC